jgi:hypothetical protein
VRLPLSEALSVSSALSVHCGVMHSSELACPGSGSGVRGYGVGFGFGFGFGLGFGFGFGSGFGSGVKG